jgi:amphi-Trp domain-containing protein
MAKKKTKSAERDVEKSYANKQTAAKLRRLAEALEAGKTFSFQIAGERVSIPPYAKIEFEHTREGEEEEVEIELTWTRK